ncbi:ATPase-activating ribosome biosynthesis protein [Lecanora helva]
MHIETCYFCSRPTYPSKGITFVRNDAKKFTFCRSKCIPISSSWSSFGNTDFLHYSGHKNFQKKRNPRKLKWTKAFRKAAGKEMLVDQSLTFAARRNIPIRYNREHVATTLKAMQRISEIRAKRERVFYKNRMAGNKQKERLENAKLVAENEHLLPRMRASEKKAMEIEEPAQLEITEIAKIPAQKEEQKITKKMKRRLLVGGGVQDEMEVD